MQPAEVHFSGKYIVQDFVSANQRNLWKTSPYTEPNMRALKYPKKIHVSALRLSCV